MIQVRRLGKQIGAEIRGVDVKTLDDTGFAELYRAWLDANVLVVPGQDLQIDEFLRYGLNPLVKAERSGPQCGRQPGPDLQANGSVLGDDMLPDPRLERREGWDRIFVAKKEIAGLPQRSEQGRCRPARANPVFIHEPVKEGLE